MCLKAKKALEKYQKRESSINEGLVGLLGPVEQPEGEETKSAEEPKTIRVTRDMLDAGKRVVTLSDTSGNSQQDTIVLTSDLSLLESKMKANAMQPVKNYPGDAENTVEPQPQQDRVGDLEIHPCMPPQRKWCTMVPNGLRFKRRWVFHHPQTITPVVVVAWEK